MRLKKRTLQKAAAPREVAANILFEGFQYAWLKALEAELITSHNIELVPRQLLRAVLLAAEDKNVHPELVGHVAFEAWQKARQKVALSHIEPASEVLH